MKAVKDLVIGKHTGFQCIVSKTFVQRTLHGDKLQLVAPAFKDIAQAVGLLCTIAADINGVALLRVVP